MSCTEVLILLYFVSIDLEREKDTERKERVHKFHKKVNKTNS